MRLGIVLALVLAAGIAIWSSMKRGETEPSAAVARPDFVIEQEPNRTLDPGIAGSGGRTGAVVGDGAPSPGAGVERATKRVLVEAVFEDDGSPIPHLPLYVSSVVQSDTDPAAVPKSSRAFTDVAGRASLDLAPGCALEFATQLDEEEEPTRVEASALDGTRIVVRRPRAPLVVFHGRILSMRGHAVAGARAVAVCEVASNDEEVPQPSDVGIVADCDASGLFRLELEPWRSVFVRVEAPGLSQRTLEPTRGHERPDQALAIHLPAAGSIVFRAEGRAGPPLAGARLRVMCNSAEDTVSGEGEDPFWAAYPRLVWSATLDAEGRASITNLPIERGLSLTLTADGRVLRRAPSGLWLEPGESHELVWRLGVGAKVTGQLVDEQGRGIAAHEMWLIADTYGLITGVLGPRARDGITSTSTTTANGSFVFEDVAAGKWKVAPRPCVAEKDPQMFYPLLAPLELAEGVGQAHVVVQVGIHTFVSGVVLDPDGTPVERAEVEARDLSFAPAVTNSAGRFRIGPLPPVDCELSARLRDGPHARSGWITVNAPNEAVELRLARGATLAGHVMGPSDQATYLRLVGLDGQDTPGRIETRDRVFRFSGLAAGRYSLSASTLDDSYLIVPRIVELAAGEARTDYEIRFEASGLIRFLGTALIEPRSVSVNVAGDPWKEVSVSVRGTTEVRVPPGEALLQVLDDDGAAIGVRVLQVEPGSTIEVDVHALGG